jgi:hopanoid biosynthesis associated RND transporter like protein HpnN
MVATVVSLVLCALLFISGYKETGRPVKATICLVVGLIYTLGFTTLTVGHLNILTITFLPILIGLGIDFGIHLVTRYEEELRRGRPERVAIELAMANTGKGIVTGCLTTAGAFLAMRFTDFRGIEEMGLISGGGLILCMLTMLTLLPVLLLRGRQNVLDHQPQVAVDRRARIERLWLERPGWVAGITLTLCLLAAGQAGRVYFDYNLLHMQSEGLPAVKFEEKLIKAATKSVLFGAVIAESPEQAIELERKLRRLPSVSDVDSVAGFLAADATRQMALIREVKKQVAGIRLPEADPEPVNLAELRLTLQTLQAYLSLGAKGAAREGEAKLSDELRQVRAAMARLRARLGGADPEAAAEKLGAFQRALFNDLRDTILTLQQQDDRAPLRPEDLPLPLRHRFVGASGHRYLLQVTPKFDVWERKTQEAFVKDLRRVDERATGTPVQLYEYTELLKNSYEEAALYALGAIVILVFLQFRNLVCVALALLPVALGTLWLVGWMGWTGLPFNPANIMTLPLVIGVGVTNGIHILTRFAEEQNPGILARSTGKAVLLSALTTVAGFGSLMPAKHQGIASLGTLMALGTTTCMIAGLTFLPALLNWLGRRGWLAPLTGLQMKPKP